MLLCRPTKSQVREAIKNFLFSYNHIKQKIMYDLCCGTGCVGLSLIPHGLKKLYMVDVVSANIDYDACAANKNIFFIKSDASNIKINNLIKNKADIIFIDPPYGDRITDKILPNIINNDMLSIGAIVIFEVSIEYVFNYIPKDLTLIKVGIYGITKVLFFRYK